MSWTMPKVERIPASGFRGWLGRLLGIRKWGYKCVGGWISETVTADDFNRMIRSNAYQPTKEAAEEHADTTLKLHSKSKLP